MARLNKRAVIKHAGAISRVAARHQDCTSEPLLCLRPVCVLTTDGLIIEQT